MKQSVRLKNRWRGIIDTVLRFPLAIFLLTAATVTDAIAINIKGEQLYKLVLAFIIGAFIYTVFQLLHERFYIKAYVRYLYMGASLLLSAVYYLYIRITHMNTEAAVRTFVILFILLIAFLWVPVIKSRISFNDSFMAFFKGFFMSAFLNGVLFLGITIIFAATNMLLTNISDKAYIHAANIIFLLLAPVYFLSLIPYYPGKEELQEDALEKDETSVKDEISEKEIMEKEEVHISNQGTVMIDIKREEALTRLTAPSKFLETLISYIVIPITVVFTLILLIYIITNITGEFWTDNLMEPLLITYSITVIIVYLLACTINNSFTRYFRLIFPKVLVPLVLFQTISSILKVYDVGITYGRYYIILFGIFATVAGILFSLRPVNKNGLIAPILIILSVISIMPLTNAFTVSKSVQILRLSHALRKNEMLDGDILIPNSKLSEKDEKTIVSAIIYLNDMDYTKDIGWLSGYRQTYNFEEAFGFPMNVGLHIPVKTFTSVTRDQNDPIPVQGYDFIARVYDKNSAQKIKWNKGGDTFILRMSSDQSIILEKNKTKINSFELSEIYKQLADINSADPLKTEDLTFSKDNDSSTITLIVESLNGYISSTWTDGSLDFYVLVDIK